MADDFERKSATLAAEIAALKRERATLTPEQEREREAERHATEDGTALNSGKA